MADASSPAVALTVEVPAAEVLLDDLDGAGEVGIDPLQVFSSPSESKRLAYELISGRCYFTGDWCRDYRYHVLNWHPLISCFFCDPVNPYKKRERVAVLLATSALSMVPSAAILTVLTWTGKSAMTKRLTVLCYVTLPVLVLQYVIEYLIYFRAVFAHRARSRRSLGCCNRSVSLCMNCAKSCCLCGALYTSFLLVAGTGSVMEAGHRRLVIDALTPLMVSRVQFWIIWFLTDLFLPWIGFVAWWRMERRLEELRVETVAELRRLQALKKAKTPAALLPTSRFREMRDALVAGSAGRLQSLLDYLARCWAPVRRCLLCRCGRGAAPSSAGEEEDAPPGRCEQGVARLGQCMESWCGGCARCWCSCRLPCCSGSGEDGDRTRDEEPGFCKRAFSRWCGCFCCPGRAMSSGSEGKLGEKRDGSPGFCRRAFRRLCRCLLCGCLCPGCWKEEKPAGYKELEGSP